MSTPKCQVIDGNGDFHETEVADFINSSGAAASRTNYQIVAIMGPQSSGKSTLLNHLFGTCFEEMDADRGRQQTTKGVWLAVSPKIDAPCTLVMDLEGSDGRERGEDDTNFERQTALFALAVADVLMVNIWCHDIGREQGSGKPLMKTILQVNLKLFAPEPNRRKTTLLFVIRDKSKTPLTKLSSILMEDMGRMWDTISKPPQYTESAITDFFEVRFAGLPHYEERQEDFVADSVVLRRRFMEDGDDALVVPHERLPADALPLSASGIWGIIRSQKDLNLPAHKVMVANIRCKEIKADQLRAFAGDQAWESLKEAASQGLVRSFGERAAALADSCVAGYDTEASYFDATVRADNRTDLLAALHTLLAGPLDAQLSRLGSQQLDLFDREFRLALGGGAGGTGTAADGGGGVGFSAAADAAREVALTGFDSECRDLLIPGAPLTADDARSKLEAGIDEAVGRAKAARLKEARHAADRALAQLITVPTVELLGSCPPGLWPKLYAVRQRAAQTAQDQLFERLQGMRLPDEERAALCAKLEREAEEKLRSLVGEAALTRVARMKEAFHDAFALDEAGTPRTWRPKDNIPALARAGRLAAAGVLAALAVVRPPAKADEETAAAGSLGSPGVAASGGGAAASRGGSVSGRDAVEAAIMAMASAEADGVKGRGGAAASGSATRGEGAAIDLATATSWPGVAPGDVLVTPQEARLAWREFVSSSSLSVQQAQVTQQANIAAGKRAPPVWALAAIMFLGWNELMAVLWNPLYLILAAALTLFGWQVYRELDVDAEMQKGALPAALALAAKLPETLRNVWQSTLAQLMEFVRTAPGVLRDGADVAREQWAAAHAGDSAGASRPAPGALSTPTGTGGTHATHVSAAGVTRRKGPDAGGIQMNEIPSHVRVARTAGDGAADDGDDGWKRD